MMLYGYAVVPVEIEERGAEAGYGASLGPNLTGAERAMRGYKAMVEFARVKIPEKRGAPK